MKVLTIANQKGGTAKTTTAAALAVLLSRTGQPVHVIDMDPQASLTAAFGQNDGEGLLYQAMIQRSALPVVRLSDTLTLTPSSIDLAKGESQFVSETAREYLLKDCLAKTGLGQGSIVIVDSPPSLGVLAVNCLAVARGLAVVVQPGGFELRALAHLEQAVQILKERVNPTIVSFLVDALVTSRERAALVDLGWGGTIHKSLQVLLMKTSPKTKLTGYYMATFPEAPHSVIPGLEVRSYLAERGKPENIYAQIVSFLNLFETVYTSNKGSVLHFAKGTDGCVQPVRQKTDKSKEQSRNLEAIHAGAFAFAAEYGRLATAKGYAAMPATVASEEFFRVIDKPTNEEAELLGGLVHCDNLGSDSTHISAELREGAGPEELLEDFKEVHWKQGALSQATPTAARLRTLLWLMEAQA